MATFKCPGCKARFDNNRALGTHKRYCKTKITAAATKLLERRKLNMEKRMVEPEGVEEELGIEGGDEVLPARPMSVSRNLPWLFYRVSYCG